VLRDLRDLGVADATTPTADCKIGRLDSLALNFVT
jgi:hypothetical protein